MRLLAALLSVAFAAPATALDRDDVIDLARDYCYHDWYCDPCNQSVDASCSTSWSSDYGTGWWTGLPYDWGGYMSLTEYDNQIAACYGAGSHSWHGILSCTAGVDCSGFVSKVWDEGHYTTSTMSSVSYNINQSDLLRADACNAPSSHIVLFTHETDSGGPVFYEASGGACKVRLYVPTSGWSYLSGYDPIRYDNITNGTARGTTSNPIEITSFPYETFDGTPGSGSDVFDSYSCIATTDESGPERVYRMTFSQSGTVTATVSDDSDTDIDLHILGSADANDCLTRDDVTVTQSVTAGTYWLVADTWVSGGGTEYPGGYSLQVTFSGNGGAGDADGDGYTVEDGDCDDDNGSVYPGAPEIADHADNDCDGLVDEGTEHYDDDGDGYNETEGDCDDDNVHVYPGATEIGDGVDNDCDGQVDEGMDTSDDDGDGYSEADGDCDDDDRDVYPGAEEVGDHVDNDCDGLVDEGTDFYDDDGDGFTEADGDCDDDDASTYPNAIDVADGVDNDCDGHVDEGLYEDDDDGDGYSEADGDCNDGNADQFPGAEEVANGRDDDCDGKVDEGLIQPNPPNEEEDGCGCRVEGTGDLAGGAAMTLLVSLLMLRRRR